MRVGGGSGACSPGGLSQVAHQRRKSLMCQPRTATWGCRLHKFAALRYTT
jgi:hypothetical protein